jgi:hypothetical protein
MGRLTSSEFAKSHGAAAGRQLHAQRQARVEKVAQRQVARRLKSMNASQGSRLVNSFINSRAPMSAEAHHVPRDGFSRFDKVNFRYRSGGVSDRAKNWTTSGWEANSVINRHKAGDWGDVLPHARERGQMGNMPNSVPAQPYSSKDKLLLSILKQTGGHSQNYASKNLHG